MRHDSSMSIFLETERLVLRRFTEDDVDNLVELDSDPDVMRFINGGRPTPRHEIEGDVLPAFLDYYERFAGYGFWAAVEKSTRRLSAGSISDRQRGLPPTRSSSATGFVNRPGERAMQLKARAR
jgi:RimJ/RimL family protein N-acetyltransferase